MTIEQRNKTAWLLISSVFLAILWDYLFYGKSFGISYPIYVIAFYIVFLFIFKEELRFAWNFAWFLFLPILLLSMTFAIYTNILFRVLNFLAIPIFLFIQTILLTQKQKHEWFHVRFSVEILKKIGYMFSNLVVPFRLLKELVKHSKSKHKYQTLQRIILALLISFPLLSFIIILLASADSIFYNFVKQILDFLLKIDLGELPIHVVLITVIFFVVFAYLWSLDQKETPAEQEQSATLPAEAEKSRRIDGIFILTILILINLVYTLFTFIQISYLFGTAENFLPPGVTYAEYARKGFAEINIVTLLNLVLLLVFMHFVSREHARVYRLVQIFLSWLTVCSLIMLYSAFFRLYMYEQAYGYTLMRLLPHAFMILIGIFLLSALAKIWYQEISLVRLYTIFSLIWYVSLNYLNLDKMVAEYNMERYKQTGEIDAYHFATLSLDAVPYLLELQKDPRYADAAKEALEFHKFQLSFYNENWQSFNYSAYQARKLLGANETKP